jgi:predicted dehydrogenase
MSFGIAVVGLDHWYTAFGVLDTAFASRGAPLVGVADPDGERRAGLREKYAGVLVTEEPDALYARNDVALVAITAPTVRAPEIAKRALAAGKHVLSVKPPARTLAELDGVIAAAERAGRFYGSFEGMQRLTPRVRMLRELIQSGAIGQAMSFYQQGHGGLPQPWPGQIGPSWWLDADQVPGGAWIDHAIYAVDLARFVFAGEIDAAAGIIERRVHENLAVEDYGASLMRLAPAGGGAGVSLIFEDTWTAAPGGGAHQQRIFGTHGSIRPEGADWVVTANGQETRHAVPEGPFFDLEALAGLLQAGETPPFGPADARANLAACLRVYEAAGARLP